MKVKLKKYKRSATSEWIHIDDKESYGDAGATVCRKCHYAMNDAYYFEPYCFRFCPRCGRHMINKTGFGDERIQVIPPRGPGLDFDMGESIEPWIKSKPHFSKF